MDEVEEEGTEGDSPTPGPEEVSGEGTARAGDADPDAAPDAVPEDIPEVAEATVEEGPAEARTDPGEGPAGPNSWPESLNGLDYSGDSWSQKLFKFFFPFALPAAIFSVLYTMMAYNAWLKLGAFSLVYLFPPAGKESVIPSGIAFGFEPWQMALLIIMVDVVTSLFITWNYPLAKKVPLIGHYIALIERTGNKKMEGNPALKAGAWLGLVLFVMVPFQGTGGITATIIGRAVGMRTAMIVPGVALGAVIAGFLIAYAAEVGISALQEDLVAGVIYILLTILAILTALMCYRLYMIRKWEREGVLP